MAEKRIKLYGDQLGKLLTSKLGTSVRYKRVIHGGDRHFIQFHDLNLASAGIWKHAVKQMSIYVRAWNQTDPKNGDRWADVHFDYTHHNGGENGHDLDFKLRLRKGKWEIFTEEEYREVA